MDYEKKYKEALVDIQELYNSMKYMSSTDALHTTTALENAFSELKESEDEKMLREIKRYIKEQGDKPTGLPNGNVAVADMLTWLEKQSDTNEIFNKDEFAQGVLRGAAINLITWIDYNTAKGNMCLSNMECKVIEDALVSGEWDKIYAYIKRKLEKQGEQKKINLVEILKHYPRETELYSPLYGKLWLAEVDEEHEIITCYKYQLDEGCTRAQLEQEDTVSFYSNGTTGLPDFSVSKDCMLFLYNIEKQCEQKPVDFKAKDWYVSKVDGKIHNMTYDTDLKLNQSSKNNMTQQEKIDKLKYLADTMYYSMQNLTTDTTKIREAMNNYRQFVISELKESEL